MIFTTQNSYQLSQSDFDAYIQSDAVHAAHDKHISLRISRNVLIALIFSLLMHALFFVVLPKIQLEEKAGRPARAIEVRLAPIRLPTKTEDAVIAPSRPPPAPLVKTPPKPKVKTPKIIAREVPSEKSEIALPEKLIKKPEIDSRLPKPSTQDTRPVEQQYSDMASYVKAQQAKRKDAEAIAAQINAEAAAKEKGPTEAQMRDERIKRNLKYGTNGIFEILSLGPTNATFSFRGWTNDYYSSKRQMFDVEAVGGQDVRLVMVRRMIVLIRDHYDGYFNWESHRLGRTVVLSARLEDNAGLEDFLMMEFFGSNYKTTQLR